MVMGLSKTGPTACVEGSRIHNVPPGGVLSYPVAKVEKGSQKIAWKKDEASAVRLEAPVFLGIQEGHDHGVPIADMCRRI